MQSDAHEIARKTGWAVEKRSHTVAASSALRSLVGLHLSRLAKGMPAVLDKQMTAQYNFYQVVRQLEASFQSEVSNKARWLRPEIT